MTGQELYKKYQQAAEKAGHRSVEAEYWQTLRTAYTLIGPNELFARLEEAESAGLRIELTYPIGVEEGYSEPEGIRMIPAFG